MNTGMSILKLQRALPMRQEIQEVLREELISLLVE
jgi:hypothetical protein